MVHGQTLVSPRRRLRAHTLGMGLSLLLAATPALAGGRRPAKETAEKTAEKKSATPRGSGADSRRGPLTYEVSAGDTLSAIAARFHLRVADLCQVNGLDPKQILRAGRVLRLPSSAKPEAETAPAKSGTRGDTDKTRAKPTSGNGETKASGTKVEAKAIGAGKAGPDTKVENAKPGSAKETASTNKVGAAKEAAPAKEIARKKDTTPTTEPASAKKAAPVDKASSSPSPALAKGSDELASLGAASLDKRALSRSKSGPSWLAYAARPKKRGYLELHSTVGRWSGQAVVDGWTIPDAARDGIAHVLASWRSGAEERIHGRLIRLLARVSDQFGGRPLRIVSGFRPHAESRFTPHSKHTLGRAVDFSIPGVPNDVLRDYLRQTFKDVGIGYYPNSTHVHLDIREETTYWVDYSGPGQAPSYGRPRPPAAPKQAQRSLEEALDGVAVSSLAALRTGENRAPVATATAPARLHAASAAPPTPSVAQPAPAAAPAGAPDEAQAPHDGPRPVAPPSPEATPSTDTASPEDA